MPPAAGAKIQFLQGLVSYQGLGRCGVIGSFRTPGYSTDSELSTDSCTAAKPNERQYMRSGLFGACHNSGLQLLKPTSQHSIGLRSLCSFPMPFKTEELADYYGWDTKARNPVGKLLQLTESRSTEVLPRSPCKPQWAKNGEMYGVEAFCG